MTSEPPNMSVAPEFEPEFVDNSNRFSERPPPGLEEDGAFWHQMDWTREPQLSAVSSGEGAANSISNDDGRLSTLLRAFSEMRRVPCGVDEIPKWHLPYNGRPLTLFELILDTDELSSELRSDEPELLQCLSEPSNLARLAELISVPGIPTGDKEVDHLRLHKLPLVAQDIVCAGTPRIGRLLLQDFDASVILLSVLQLPPVLEERLATRFTNVLGMLLLKCPDHVVLSLHDVGLYLRTPLDDSSSSLNPSMTSDMESKSAIEGRLKGSSEEAFEKPSPEPSEVCQASNTPLQVRHRDPQEKHFPWPGRTSREAQFSLVTSLNREEDPIVYCLLGHLGNDAIAECLKCSVTQSAAPALSFFPSAHTLMLHLVEQIGMRQAWDTSLLDTVERTETIVSVIAHVMMSGPSIQDFDVLLASLVSPEAYDLLLRGLGCGCADIARASSDVLSLILTKCEEHLSMAEYDTLNNYNNAAGSPSPPRSTPLVKPNIPLPPPSPPLMPAGETAPLSVIDTGPVNANATAWDSGPTSPPRSLSPQSPGWPGETGGDTRQRPHSWQDEVTNSGWNEGGTGQSPPGLHTDADEPDEGNPTAYHREPSETYRLSDNTLMAMREFANRTTSGPLQDLLSSYIIPQVHAVRQYRRGRRGRNTSLGSEVPGTGQSSDNPLMPTNSQSPNVDSSPMGSETPRRIFTDDSSPVEFVPAKSMDTTTSATWEKVVEEVWGPAPPSQPSTTAPPEHLPESTSGSTVPSANEALSPEKTGEKQYCNVIKEEPEPHIQVQIERIDLPQGNKPRVGGLCLSFVNLLHSILQLDTPHTRDVAAKLVPALVELFFAYKWNTLLHNSVKQIVVYIIDVVSPHSQELLKRLVNDSGLLTQIVKLCKRSKKIRQERDPEVRRQKRLRHKVGYMPQVIQIAEALIARSKSDHWLQETLSSTVGWSRSVLAEMEYTMSVTNEQLGSPVPHVGDLFNRIPNTESMAPLAGGINYLEASSMDDSASSDSDSSGGVFGLGRDISIMSGSGEQVGDFLMAVPEGFRNSQFD